MKWLIILFIQSFLIVYIESSLDCSDSTNEDEFNSYCYFLTPIMTSWFDSIQYCKNWNNLANLASITSIEENTYLMSLASKLNRDFEVNYYWIGLKRTSPFGYWAEFWVDGNPFVLDYFSFDLNVSPDGCAEYRVSDGEWGDWECVNEGSGQAGVCRYPLCDCHNGGHCGVNRSCVCDSCYQGETCETGPLCGNTIITDPKVCNSSGSCISCNDCECLPSFFGGYCAEKITIAKFNYGVNLGTIPKEVHIIYEFDTANTVNSIFLDESFYCEKIINNTQNLGLTSQECRFTYQTQQKIRTKNLIISLKSIHEIKIGSTIILNPITRLNDDEHVSVEVMPSGSPFSDNPLVFVVFVGFIIIMMILLILGICIFLISTICCCLFCKKKKKRPLSEKGGETPGNEEVSIEMLEERESTKMFASINVNTKLFSIPYSDLKVIRKIGKGGFATVYHCKWQHNSVAFKVFQTSSLFDTQNDFADFEREVNILASLSHPNILVFYGGVIKVPRIGMVIEYCENGHIKDYLTENDKYPYKGRLTMLKGVCNGMCYLHKSNLIHRDLKPENVLLTSQLICKIIDFGLSRFFDNKDANSQKTQRIGTSMYMSPQVFLVGKYSNKCDVYSFAIMAFEILTGNFEPFGAQSYGIESKTANDQFCRPDLNNNFFENKNWLKECLSRCWADQESDRDSFNDLYLLFEQKVDELEK